MTKAVEMEDKVSKPAQHKPLLAFMIVFTALCYAFVMFISTIQMSDLGSEWGIFTNSNQFSNDRNYIEITPASWTFSIWGFIYAWQIIWMIYVIVGLFRKNSEGVPVYTNPEILSPLCYCAYIVNLGCNVGWLVLWDRDMITWSLIPIALLPFTLYICLAVSHMRLNASGSYMMKTGMNKDIWMIRFFIQNGLALYATWVTIATLLNFSIALSYSSLNVDQSLSSTVSLSILAFELIAWFILDVFILERYTRYLVTPYIVVNLALVGSLVKNYTPGATNSIFTLVLLALAAIAGLVKVVMLFYRHFTRPLFTGDLKTALVEEVVVTKM